MRRFKKNKQEAELDLDNVSDLDSGSECVIDSNRTTSSGIDVNSSHLQVIPKSDIKIRKQLGGGAFGVVYEAKWK